MGLIEVVFLNHLVDIRELKSGQFDKVPALSYHLFNVKL